MNIFFKYIFKICILLDLSALNLCECPIANFGADPCDIALLMKFHLHTRTLYKQFNFRNLVDLLDLFQAGKYTKIIIHGWQAEVDSPFNLMLIDSYLHLYDANIITVEWSLYADCLNYAKAVHNVRAVGKTVAYLLDRLNGLVGLDPRKTHLIGFSLGAHVAGIAGSLAKLGKVYRITGLDPAGPLFDMDKEHTFRLRNDSARFVDVIHTAMAFPGITGVGTADVLGTVDFYPNGGTAGFSVFKYHRLAYLYFNESILTPGGFMAKRCLGWILYKLGACKYSEEAEMGEHVSHGARGTYYLNTNDDPPYSKSKLTTRYFPVPPSDRK